MQQQTQSSKIFWIHCNQCFVNYIQKERQIYILSCYHVVCEKCTRIVKQEQVECPVCKKCLGRRLICNSLHPKLKELFHPRPWMLNFPKSFPIVKFQTKQRDNFMLGCRKMYEYNKKLESERDRVKEECREAYLNKKRLGNERKQLEAMLRKLQREKSVSKRINLSTSNDSVRSIEIPETSKRCRRTIHPTYSAPENEYTFEFPNESHFSKSFIL